MLALIGKPAHASPPSSKIVPPDPPLLRPSRLGRTTASAARRPRTSRLSRGTRSRLMNPGSSEKSSCCRMHRKFGDLGLRSASSRRSNSGLSTGFTSRMSPKKNDLARQLALVLVEVFLVLHIHPNRLAADWAVGRRRPGRGLRDEYRRVRRRHAHPGVQLPPAHAELAPVFEMSVAATHRGQLIARPLIGAASGWVNPSDAGQCHPSARTRTPSRANVSRPRHECAGTW